MKRLFASLLLLTGFALADTSTTNLGLTKPSQSSTNWGTKVNNNYDIIDSSVAILAGTNTFTGSNTFNGSISFGSTITFSTTSFSRVLIATPTYSGSDVLAFNGTGRTNNTFYSCDSNWSSCLSVSNSGINVPSGASVNLNDSSGNTGATLSNPYGSGIDYLTITSTAGVGINVSNSNFYGLSVAGGVATSTITASSATLTAVSVSTLLSKNCLGTDSTGAVQEGNCGGSGGSSSLETMANSVRITSPTATQNFVGGTGIGISGAASGSTATITASLLAGSSYYWNTPSTGTFVNTSHGIVASTVTATSIGKDRVVYAGTNGLLSGSSAFKFHGSSVAVRGDTVWTSPPLIVADGDYGVGSAAPVGPSLTINNRNSYGGASRSLQCFSLNDTSKGCMDWNTAIDGGDGLGSIGIGNYSGVVSGNMAAEFSQGTCGGGRCRSYVTIGNSQSTPTAALDVSPPSIQSGATMRVRQAASGNLVEYTTGSNSLILSTVSYSGDHYVPNLYAQYGAIAATMTVSGLAVGECVQTTTGGLLTTTGSACGSGGGGGGDNLGSHIATKTVSAPYGISASTIVVSSMSITGETYFGTVGYIDADGTNLRVNSYETLVLEAIAGGGVLVSEPTGLDVNYGITTQDITVESLTPSECVATDGSGKLVSSGGACGGGSGGGDNLGSHIATMTVTANYGVAGSTFAFVGPQQSTVTYGLTVGSLTVTGGSGNLSFSNDSGSNFYQVVGSSTNATPGTCAQFTSSWTIVGITCPTGGAGGGGYNVQPATVSFNLAQGATVSSMTVSSNTYLANGSSFYYLAEPQFAMGPIIADMTADRAVITGSGKKLTTGQINLASGNYVTGVLLGTSFPAMTGDVTNSAGSLSTSLAATLSGTKTFLSTATFVSSITVSGLLTGTTIQASSATINNIQTPLLSFTTIRGGTISAGTMNSTGGSLAFANASSGITFGATNSDVVFSNANGTGQVLMQNHGGLTVTYGATAATGTFTTGLTIPNGTAPTVDVTGKIAYDTTDGALIAYNGVTTDVIAVATQTVSVTISSGTGWGGLTIPVFRAPTDMAVTVTKIIAESLPTGTTVLYQLNERAFGTVNTAGTDVFSVGYSTANNSGVTTTTFNDASIAAQSSLVFRTPTAGSSAGNPDAITFTIYYKRDRE